MNDVFKLLSKAIAPFGYHIRPKNGLAFLRVPALETHENDSNVGAVRTAMQAAAISAPLGNLNAVHVILRTCLRTRRNVNPRPRITGDDPFENGYRCVRSLTRAIDFAKKGAPSLSIHFTVLDDRSDKTAEKTLRDICKGADFRTTDQTGQGASLHQAFTEGRSKDALIYCVEDDYLHEEDAILRLWEFYKFMAAQSGTHMVLYPQEHPRLYAEHYPSYIVKGADRHWRSMRHATHTFLTHGTVMDENWNRCFENTKFVGNKKTRKKGSESKTTDRLFTKISGFSPLKPCAVHLQYEELIPPFYDWRPLWDKSAA